jgi:hypothetical protein
MSRAVENEAEVVPAILLDNGEQQPVSAYFHEESLPYGCEVCLPHT